MKIPASLILALLVGLCAASGAEPEREERIFAYYSTTSVTSLTTVTITGLSTCLSTTSAACLGRRKRNVFKAFSEFDDEEATPVELEGSQEPEVESNVRVERAAEEPGSRQGKKITIWSTNFTTLTITSTSVQPSTTVTASALCAAPGVTAGCFLG